MKKTKKIKNKFIRRILRTIANWDNCPKDYKRNWSAVIFNWAVTFVVCYIVMMCFAFLMIKFM
jgi:hypothetical protein